MGSHFPNSVNKSARAKLAPVKPVPTRLSHRSASIQTSSVPSRRSQPLARRGWSWGWAIALGFLATAGAMSLGWLSLHLIVNPQSVKWVNRWVPGWQVKPSGDEPTKTLHEIRAELRQQGLQTGELLTLGKSQSVVDGKTTATDVLLPVIQSAVNCFTNCDRIVELRVYQAAPTANSVDAAEPYYLVYQLAVSGIEESFAIAPLVDATSQNQGSSRLLPLTTLSRYEGTVPTPGIWFSLSGSRSQGSDTIAYGQMLYYYPPAHHLSVKLDWTSPTGETPVWKAVAGGKSPNLLVNQTIGMEPQFEIYQVKPQPFLHSPVQLNPISLTTPALEDGQYNSALMLARNRLWSTSLAWLQSVRGRSLQPQATPSWNDTAQAQLALIRWHAQATATQAESSWASPSQQILANLLDGRWERATTVFTSSVAASQEMVGVLKADQGRLANRVKAALRVNSSNLDAKIWGALLMAVQQNPQAAIAWLQKQPKTKPQDVTRVQALFQRLDSNFDESTGSVSKPDDESLEAPPPTNSTPSQ